MDSYGIVTKQRQLFSNNLDYHFEELENKGFTIIQGISNIFKKSINRTIFSCFCICITHYIVKTYNKK